MNKLIDLLTCLLLIILLIVFFALVFGAIDYLHRLIDASAPFAQPSCYSCNSWLSRRYPMIIGMLWFDNSPTSDLAAETVIAGVTIKPNRSVMPNHYWIGVEDAP